MSIQYWIILHAVLIGCYSIEVGVFLRKLDKNLIEKLANPNIYNATQFFQDLSAYSFNIGRLLRLFKLKRENIMETAKCVYKEEHPTFIKNFTCEKVKSDFSLNEKEYKNLLHFTDKITRSLNDFYKLCEDNPGFVGVPAPKPVFALERISSDIDAMFKSPDPKIEKHKIIRAVEEYYYLLGKFTKKFILGRRAVMQRAKQIFESGGPQFLKHYDHVIIKKAYSLNDSDSTLLDNLIRKIHKRYELFSNACFKNPNFESKIDFSSIKIVRECDQSLRRILLRPSENVSGLLFKHLRDLYQVLGFLRRKNIPNQMELLKALNETFRNDSLVILKTIDFDKLKIDFGLEESMAIKIKEYINHLRRRYSQVQHNYLVLIGQNQTASTTCY